MSIRNQSPSGAAACTLVTFIQYILLLHRLDWWLGSCGVFYWSVLPWTEEQWRFMGVHSGSIWRPICVIISTWRVCLWLCLRSWMFVCILIPLQIYYIKMKVFYKYGLWNWMSPYHTYQITILPSHLPNVAYDDLCDFDNSLILFCFATWKVVKIFMAKL